MGTKLVIHPAGGLPPCTDADHQFCTIIVFRARYVTYLYIIYIYIYVYIFEEILRNHTVPLYTDSLYDSPTGGTAEPVMAELEKLSMAWENIYNRVGGGGGGGMYGFYIII